MIDHMLAWTVRVCRSIIVSAAVVCGVAALAAPPSQWSNCAGCHAAGGNASNPPLLPSDGTNIIPNGAAAGDVTALRATMGAVAGDPMGAVLGSISDGDLEIVRVYLTAVRDGRVSASGGSSTAFGSAFIGAGGSIQTFSIANERGVAATFTSVPGGSNGEFAVVGGGTCPTNTVISMAAGTSCTVNMQFTPAGAGARAGALRFRLNSPTGITTQQVSLGLSGTGKDPAPIYAPSGFAPFTSPGFTAATDGVATTCGVITNANLAGGNTLSISVASAQSGGTDYSNYYEIGSVTDCGAGVWPAACVPAALSVTGSATPLAAGGGACTLAIKFDPAKIGFVGGTGARSAQLRVTHNDPAPGTIATYTLVGNATLGPQPTIGVSASPGVNLPAEFSNQVINTASALSTFQVSNIGQADGLDLTQVTLSNTAEFALTVENCVAAPPLAKLVAGSPTCAIGLTFTPNALGQRCTTVSVVAAVASNTPQVVTVCGTGVPVPAPQQVVTPTAIAFGPRSIGAIYLPANLLIQNALGATAPLNIGTIALSGGGFALVPDATPCQNRLLLAGTGCVLQVQFTPDPNLPGASYSSTLTINSNDPVAPHQTIALTATAVAHSVPALQWQVVSTTLSFPDAVIAGQQSALPLVAKLANVDGPGAVDVQAVRLVGPDASSFTISSCPALLYQGESCDVSVRFTPGSGGLKTAQIEVVSTTGVAPPTLTVQGQGAGATSAVLITSNNALAFGGVRVGANSEPLVLTLSASGAGVLQVTSITADTPFSVVSQTCPPVPFSLPPGGDCNVSVTFTPTVVGDATATLRIGTGASAQAAVVSLDGVGQASADVSSGGGCSIASGDALADPTLWALAVLALAVLWYRRRGDESWRRAARQRRGPP